jgi:hypothetical protein
MFAEAAARYLTTWCRPNDLVFAPTNQLRKWYGDTHETVNAVDDADGQSARPMPDVSFIARHRLTWTRPGGPSAGLLLDRFHTAHRLGAVARDQGIYRKVAKDLTDAALFLAPATALAGDTPLHQSALLGVRVLAHKAPNAGVHFVPTFLPNGMPVIGSHHPLGGCPVCASTPHLPTNPSALAPVPVPVPVAAASIISTGRVR